MTRDVTGEFGLPELPPLIDACDTDENTRELVIYQQFVDEKISLGYVTEKDAREYCERDDTRDPAGDWFVGFRRIV